VEAPMFKPVKIKKVYEEAYKIYDF
jgi:hypothetical protein